MPSERCPICGKVVRLPQHLYSGLPHQHRCSPKILASIDGARQSDGDQLYVNARSEGQRLIDGFAIADMSGDNHE